MSGVKPSLRDRLEALYVIIACLALFGISAYLCHVWRYPRAMNVPPMVQLLEGTCVDLETEI